MSWERGVFIDVRISNVLSLVCLRGLNGWALMRSVTLESSLFIFQMPSLKCVMIDVSSATVLTVLHLVCRQALNELVKGHFFGQVSRQLIFRTMSLNLMTRVLLSADTFTM